MSETTLPTQEELDESFSVLSVAQDRVTRPLLRRLGEFINATDDRSGTTIADVGRLMVFVHDARSVLDMMRRDLDLAEQVIVGNIGDGVRCGTDPHSPSIDAKGFPIRMGGD